MIVKVQYVIDIYHGAENFEMSGTAMFGFWFTVLGLLTVALLIVLMLGYSLKTIK